MKQEERKEFIEIIGEALEEIVIPRFDGLEKDMKEVKETLEDHDKSLNRIERMLDAHLPRIDEHSVILRNHEKRITKLEKA